ncbi:MAG: HDOD domain-containing protein [Saccharospirillaceae bacterium]|nr:HDOD domain-containing protein [Pseudomonadales bacterium]NRB79064.1 HDOD domain-containing protein [Saccharospirillaceae bacterium]
MDQVLFAKQPILDRNQNTIAYELLYRRALSDQRVPNDLDHNLATAQVLVSALSQYTASGENEIIFINFPKDLLFTPPPFETHNQIVIEILESVIVDDSLIKQIRVLKKMGYHLALDDYQGDIRFDRLLEFMDIIKVEVLYLHEIELNLIIEKLKPFKCKLLAEKVENQSMFDDCLALGFKYFQGFYFSKPIIITGQKMNQNQASLLRLMSKIYKPDVSLSDISLLVSQDPELCLGLLKLVNSALFKRDNTINSIQQTCSILGLVELRNWIQLLSFAKFDDRPNVFHFQSLLCALLMKNIATHHSKINPDEAFTVGICVHLETIINLPIDMILEQLPFEQHLKKALSNQEGELGKLLKFCLQYIEGQWGNLDWDWLKLEMTNDELLPSLYEKAYLESKQSYQ